MHTHNLKDSLAMTDKKPHKIISPSNTLQAKVGIDPAALHHQAVERANQALEELKSEFTEWISKDLEKLKAARNIVRDDPKCAKAIEDLRVCVHDLKGLGTTYGFPMVSRLSASLCRLIESVEESKAATALPMTLVDSHINAILAVVSEEITTQDDARSKAVAESLEEMTAKQIAALS